jgi:ribosomal protein L24E
MKTDHLNQGRAALPLDSIERRIAMSPKDYTDEEWHALLQESVRQAFQRPNPIPVIHPTCMLCGQKILPGQGTLKGDKNGVTVYFHTSVTDCYVPDRGKKKKKKKS